MIRNKGSRAKLSFNLFRKGCQICLSAFLSHRQIIEIEKSRELYRDGGIQLILWNLHILSTNFMLCPGKQSGEQQKTITCRWYAEVHFKPSTAKCSSFTWKKYYSYLLKNFKLHKHLYPNYKQLSVNFFNNNKLNLDFKIRVCLYPLCKVRK